MHIHGCVIVVHLIDFSRHALIGPSRWLAFCLMQLKTPRSVTRTNHTDWLALATDYLSRFAFPHFYHPFATVSLGWCLTRGIRWSQFACAVGICIRPDMSRSRALGRTPNVNCRLRSIIARALVTNEVAPFTFGADKWRMAFAFVCDERRRDSRCARPGCYFHPFLRFFLMRCQTLR